MKPEQYQKEYNFALYSIAIIFLGVLIWSGSFLFKPKTSELTIGKGGVVVEKANEPVGEGKDFTPMELNGKTVTNTEDYTVERDKVIAEIKKIDTTSTIDVNALTDFSKIVVYEKCRVNTTNISLPEDTDKLIKDIGVAIEVNQCL